MTSYNSLQRNEGGFRDRDPAIADAPHRHRRGPRRRRRWRREFRARRRRSRDRRTAMSTDTLPTGHVHDWDWLVGRWTVRHRRLTARLAGSTEWEEFAGT